MARFIVTIEGMGDFPLHDRELAERCFKHYSTSIVEGEEHPGTKEVVLVDTQTNKTIKHYIPQPPSKKEFNVKEFLDRTVTPEFVQECNKFYAEHPPEGTPKEQVLRPEKVVGCLDIDTY